jgi:DNA-binding GntR family transcriptional regulator
MPDKKSPKESSTGIIKKQKAYDYIHAKILDGTFPPGSHITISQIANVLGLSNSPVREAMQQLESESFIQIKPYVGAIVQLVNENEYTETMYVLGILSGSATALSAEHLTKADIDEMKTLNEEMKECIRSYNFGKFSELNQKFHEVSYAKCGNSYLLEHLKLTWQRISQGRNAVFPVYIFRATDSVKEHDVIIKMIQEKASQKRIETYVRMHKLNMVKAATAYKNKSL